MGGLTCARMGGVWGGMGGRWVRAIAWSLADGSSASLGVQRWNQPHTVVLHTTGRTPPGRGLTPLMQRQSSMLHAADDTGAPVCVWPGWQAITQGRTCQRSGNLRVERTIWLHESGVLLGQLWRVACARYRRCTTRVHTGMHTCTLQQSSTCLFLLEAAATPSSRGPGS